MTRLEMKLAKIKKAGKKGLFIYITAGAPDIKTTIDAVKAAEKAGADVIELGIPFSDPMADGPVIQAAAVTAIKNGMTVQKVLELVGEIRQFSDIPLIGMGYINNMLNYGFERFVREFKAAGMDGLILPDVPHEEAGDMRRICQEHEFHLIEFVTPGTNSSRMDKICASANGFVYCVSVNGVTGVRKIDYSPIHRVIEQARRFTDVPMAVGFGIGSAEAAREAADKADAVIVGSAVVKLLQEKDIRGAAQLIATIRQALDEGVK
jgi:tryptophan synthase alpha chain